MGLCTTKSLNRLFVGRQLAGKKFPALLMSSYEGKEGSQKGIL